MTLKTTKEALAEIKKHPNLEKFKDDEGEKFCKKYKIKGGQLNLLISVIAVERSKEKNISI